MSKLEKLLESIDPSITYEKISSRVNSALNSFTVDTFYINEIDNLKRLLTGFYGHVFQNILGINENLEVGTEIFWGPCQKILEEEYGSRWIITTMEICNSQIEGGLYGILKKLAEGMIAQYAKNEIISKISTFWDDLTIDESLAIADEYLEKFGDLLPYDLKVGNAVRLRMNMFNVLVNHPKMVQDLRNLRRF